MMFVFIFSVCNRGCGPKWGNVEGGGGDNEVEKKGCWVNLTGVDQNPLTRRFPLLTEKLI